MIDDAGYDEATKISIHAPARGATSTAAMYTFAVPHFNPRTREGCDNAALPAPDVAGDFNPRTREGCDHFNSNGICVADAISIHAPARGATAANNNTARNAMLFQSTHPRGVRPLVGLEFTIAVWISIHAPARGATGLGERGELGEDISIHAPARGATRGCYKCKDRAIISIHAPARGATGWNYCTAPR